MSVPRYGCDSASHLVIAMDPAIGARCRPDPVRRHEALGSHRNGGDKVGRGVGVVNLTAGIAAPNPPPLPGNHNRPGQRAIETPANQPGPPPATHRPTQYRPP